MYNGKPDDIDLKIMYYLQVDARISHNKLAGLVNLTVAPLGNRIEKLEEAGLIKKYMAILDREKIGLPVLVMLMVTLRRQNTGLLEIFESMVVAMPEVLSCHNMSGDWNFTLHVAAETPQLYAVWLLEKISSHRNVKKVESAFLLKESKSNGPFSLKC